MTRTRMGTVWFGAASFAVVLVLLLIFILQNSRTVQISYLGAHGHLPQGVALLLAAILGILLVVIPGTARIIQLRITARGIARSMSDTPTVPSSRPERPDPRPETARESRVIGTPQSPAYWQRRVFSWRQLLPAAARGS